MHGKFSTDGRNSSAEVMKYMMGLQASNMDVTTCGDRFSILTATFRSRLQNGAVLSTLCFSQGFQEFVYVPTSDYAATQLFEVG